MKDDGLYQGVDLVPPTKFIAYRLPPGQGGITQRAKARRAVNPLTATGLSIAPFLPFRYEALGRDLSMTVEADVVAYQEAVRHGAAQTTLDVSVSQAGSCLDRIGRSDAIGELTVDEVVLPNP